MKRCRSIAPAVVVREIPLYHSRFHPARSHGRETDRTTAHFVATLSLSQIVCKIHNKINVTDASLVRRGLLSWAASNVIDVYFIPKSNFTNVSFAVRGILRKAVKDATSTSMTGDLAGYRTGDHAELTRASISL